MGQACMPGTPPASTTPPSTPPPAAPPPTTPPPTTPPPATNDPFAVARDRCVQKTNAFRATKSVAAVARRGDREKCADKQAEADALASQPHGRFGKCGESAQNECPGWKGTPESTVDSCLQAMFDEGPGTGPAHGHYNNMMNPKYASVSCGFYVTSDGSIWLVQDFYLR
jgi:uncharacterized protein YkwD